MFTRANGDATRAKILEALQLAPDGLTIRQLAGAIQMSWMGISHQIRNLARDQKIRPSGKWWGRQKSVLWVAVTETVEVKP